MRREDRRTWILHPDLARQLRNVAEVSDLRPVVQDPDICLHCRKHQCIAVCLYGAIASTEDGRITIDTDACAGTGACLVACDEFRNLAPAR